MAVNTSLPGAYQSQQLDAEQAYQQALTSIAARQATLAHDTGFTYNQDAGGSVSDVHIDPHNQYSQVMDLMAGHADTLHTLRNSLAGKGLGNVGLAGKRAALLKFRQTGDTSKFGASFISKLAGLQGEKVGALSAKNAAFTSAEQAALLYALQNQQFNTASPSAVAEAEGNTGAVSSSNTGTPTNPGGKIQGGTTYVTPPTMTPMAPLSPWNPITTGKWAGVPTVTDTVGLKPPPQQRLVKLVANTIKSPYAGQIARNSY